MRNKQIIPAILATTEEEYRTKLEKIGSCQELSQGWIQIDLMDNKFVQNKSIDASVIGKYPTNLKKEAHLMVVDPLNWIEALVKVGIKRVIFPVEVEEVESTIIKVKGSGLQVGLACNPETPVAKVTPFIDKIDVVLLLAVYPGFGGGEFVLETLEKIRELSKLRGQNKFLIEVDGGINESVAKEIVEAGADNLVIGSHLIDGNITENLEKIWQSLRG